jgi:5'-deoxynucleotidase YfbR-like HD superfamily hydrolase
MDTRLKTQPQRDANLRALRSRLKGGHVVRYHTRPELADGQNVAAHTWRVMVVIHTLWPEQSTKNLLLHALYHDVAEAEVGDMPATTKWKYSELNNLMRRVESEYESKLGVAIPVSPDEQKIADIADKLELVLHCYRLMQRGNGLAEDVFHRGCDYLKDKYKGHPVFQPAEEVINELLQSLTKQPKPFGPILQKLHQL